jgi:eukaryotic-like serine/threonine-protein kinase
MHEAAMTDASAAFAAGLAPEFEVLRPLGKGATGSVYLARETALRRLVAIKVPLPELARDPEVRRRFEREARAAARLRHPGIAAIHRIARLPDDTPYLVMEYVDGQTLDDVRRGDGPLEATLALAALIQVAEALAVAHAHGVIHRDVRPGNVIWVADEERAVLTDFGIAGILDSGTEVITRLTRPGVVLGDPAYRSPEQLLGEPLTPAADIYGWGLLAFELLTGQRPFIANTPEAVASAHLRQPPRSLLDARAEADPRMAELIEHCLAKSPRHRPSAAALARSLGQLRADQNRPAPRRAGAGMLPGLTEPRVLAGFLGELRRRRVYNVAIGYAAIAFVLLQAAGLVIPALPLPEPAYPLVVALTLAGFPVALVLAWMYDLTGAGIRRTEAAQTPGPAFLRWLLPTIGLLVSLLLAALIGWWVLGGR